MIEALLPRSARNLKICGLLAQKNLQKPRTQYRLQSVQTATTVTVYRYRNESNSSDAAVLDSILYTLELGHRYRTFARVSFSPPSSKTVFSHHTKNPSVSARSNWVTDCGFLFIFFFSNECSAPPATL